MMKPLYLVFQNEEEAKSVLFDENDNKIYDMEIANPMPMPISKLNDSGEYVIVDGYHVNVLVQDDFDETILETYIIRPTTPAVIWML